MVQTNFLVKKRKISQLDSVPLTGEYNIDTFHFDFDEEWEGLDKTLVLISGGQRYNIALLNNEALMPFETYQIKGNVQIGLFGTDNGYRTLATGWLPLYIEEDSYEVNTEPENLPSPTQWDLYVTEINRLLALCEASEENCQSILNQMQLDYESYVAELNQIKSDTEGIKQDTQAIYNQTNQIKTDVQTLKRQVEQDIAGANLKIEEYNQNAQQKTNTFNQNVTEKTNTFNQNVTDKTNTFNQNATDKTTAFNNNATSKTNDFNDNVTSKTNTFNQNAQDKQDAVTLAGTTAVGNVQDAEGIAITHIQTEGASYDARLDDLEAVTGTGTDTFSTSSTYEVGDVVVYENKLYRCITAIETAGAWDSTKWQEINLRQEQDEQNGKIEQLETDVDLLASNYDPKEVTIEGMGAITDTINWYGESVPIGNTEQNTTSISGGDEYDSPSPEHPQSIHNVSGNVVTDVRSNNLFDWRNYTYDQTTLATYRFVQIKGLKPLTTYSLYGYDEAIKNSVFTNVYLTYKNVFSSVTSAGAIWAKNNNTYNSTKTRTTTEDGTMYLSVNTTETWSETVWNKFMQYFKNAMFVEGSDTTIPYAEYGRETKTFPLSEGQKMYEGDYLADDGIHHVRKQKIFDGTEDIRVVSNYDTTDYYCYRLNFADSRRSKLQTELETLKCTHLKQITWYKMYNSKTNELGCSTSVDSTFVYFKVPFSTLENFKAWLATQYANSDPVIIEYELSNETVEPYTEAQQIVWEKLKKTRTYKGATHVMASSDDLAPDLKVTYLQNPLASIEARLELLES